MRLWIKPSKGIVAGLTIILIFKEAVFSFIPSSRAQTIKRKSANEIASPQKYSVAAAMLNGFIRCEMADKRLPGIAVGLVDGQKSFGDKNYGFADPQAKNPITAGMFFRVSSVSRNLLAISLKALFLLLIKPPQRKYTLFFQFRS